MVEAVVGVALRAIVASIILGGVLGLGVFAATRLLALTAATRHALWTMALLATAIMPVAGVGVSVARGLTAEAPLPLTPFPKTSAPIHLLPPPHISKVTRTAPRETTAPPTDRLAVARGLAGWQPKVSRTIALGIVGAWMLGALIGLIGLLLSVLRVRGLKKRSSPLEGALADELPWLTEVGPGREIYLRLSYEIETPVAIGFRRPVILIPTELATVDGLTAIEPLVLHEHAHLRRYDDWTNMLQRVIERIFWFNPILWYVGRRIALEREIASDDAVVEKTGAAHAYATSLWRLAREMRMPEHAVVAPGALLTRKQISVRIEQLLDKNRSRLHRSPAAALAVVVAGAAAVAFVATSAPAVELPAATTIASSSHHTAFVQKIVVTRDSPEPAIADPLTDQKIAEVESRYEPAATAPPAPTVTSAPTPRVQKHVTTAKHTVTTTHQTVANVTTDATMTTPPVPPVPAVPSVPPMPYHAAPPPVIRVNVDGHDVSKIVSDALRSIPRTIAQESASTHATAAARHYSRPPGAVITREILASCTGCSLRGADLHGQDLRGITLNATDLTAANLSGANLAGAKLIGVSLHMANLGGADLTDASLNGVSIKGASFEGAKLDGIKLIGVSIKGANFHGTVLRSLIASCNGCDFSHMDLHGQDLHGISLVGADFNGADLHDANLSGSSFNGVDFSHANLSGADLTSASFTGCDLRGSNRTGIRTAGLRLNGSDID
ncbi:MAG TPA: pentapeptide repeat-containing protein [Candidatus Elarobacter sp.]